MMYYLNVEKESLQSTNTLIYLCFKLTNLNASYNKEEVIGECSHPNQIFPGVKLRAISQEDQDIISSWDARAHEEEYRRLGEEFEKRFLNEYNSFDNEIKNRIQKFIKNPEENAGRWHCLLTDLLSWNSKGMCGYLLYKLKSFDSLTLCQRFREIFCYEEPSDSDRI